MYKVNLLVFLTLLIVSNSNCLDLKTFYKYLNVTQKSSPECQLQKDTFLFSLKNRTEWAVKSEYNEVNNI